MDGVEPEDSRFDAAPLPPHERAWRHPSEVGEITWRRSEPPLTIGRGLLFTTGAIGGLLALAVLWTTLPTGAGSSVAVVSTQAARAARVSTIPAPSELVNGETPSGGSLPVGSAAVAGPPATTTSLLEPTGGADVGERTGGPPTTLHLSGATSAERSAVAVLVGTSAVVITTAGAIDPDDVVTLTSGDGGTRTAKVMLIYRGVAVLEPESGLGSTSLVIGTPAHAGDMVTVIGSAAVSVPIGARRDGGVQIDRWGDSDAPEGAPVINRDGQLVGLCRHSKTGPEMVVVDADALRSMVGAATAPKDPAGEATTEPTTTVLAGSSTNTLPKTSASSTPTTGSTPSSGSSNTTVAAGSTSTAPATTGAIVPGTSGAPASTPTKASTTVPASSTTVAPAGAPRTGGWLGVQLDANATAATIVVLDPNGPAATSGLKIADTITSVDGISTPTAAELAGLLATHLPGDKVRVTVRRIDAPDGVSNPASVATTSTVSVMVTLGEPPTAT